MQVRVASRESGYCYDELASDAYQDKETNTHYNYFRDYDPAIGRYIQSDPIGLEGGINTYAYVMGNPLKYVDSKGLEAELCTRMFYPVPVPYARHCFVRFDGNKDDTLSYDKKGVHPDPNPDSRTAMCSPTKGDQDDDCVRREMKKCQASQFDISSNNCCHCAEAAFRACGLRANNFPNWPFNPGPPASSPPRLPKK